MRDHELVLAISDLLDRKLKMELQPVRADIAELKRDVAELKDDVVELKADVAELKADVAELKADVAVLKADVAELKCDVRNLERRTTNIELHLENETDRNIRLLAENYVPAARRYEQEAGRIDAMQADIDVMKRVIAEHSEKLQRLA